MSEIPPELIDKMMVKCGRRCCICRRSRQTKLQVHHIREKGQGGSDEEDNLIVLCLSCHSDVHTKVPFARKFSENEQKGHRDALVKRVADGVFPAEDTDDTDEAIRVVIREMRSVPTTRIDLLPEAIEILLAAANAQPGLGQGEVNTSWGGGFTVQAGGGDLTTDPSDSRKAARYRHALKQLVRCDLLEHLSEDFLEVTHQGYLIADEFAARGSQALTE